MLMLKLHPCPRCRRSEGLKRSKVQQENGAEGWYVCCTECSFEGPRVYANVPGAPAAYRYTTEEAQKLASEQWNMASFPPRQPVVFGQPVTLGRRREER